MPLNFAGLPIPGAILHSDLDPPSSEVVRTHYAGLDGVTQIELGVGGRRITYIVWLYDRSFATAAPLLALLKKFDERVQANGKLVETGNFDRTFHNCTFEGCKKLHDPLPDHAKTVVHGVFTWHCQVALTWFQLSLEDD